MWFCSSKHSEWHVDVFVTSTPGHDNSPKALHSRVFGPKASKYESLDS